MVDQQQQSEAGYERLGGKKLGLVDVVAQSVGFMGPVFSAAFIIPLIIGVNAAARRARGRRRRSPCCWRGVGVFALGLDRRAVREADPRRRGACTTTCRTAWARCVGTAVRLPLLRGHDHPDDRSRRADRRIRPRQPDAGRVQRGGRALPDLGVGPDLRSGVVRGPVLRRPDLDARAADAGVGLGRRRAHVLPVDHRPAGRRQRLRRRRSTRTRPRTGSAGSCSASCTGC